MVKAKRSIRIRPPPCSCLSCPTRHLAEWTALSDREMAQVEKIKNAQGFHRGQVLFRQNQTFMGIYCIHSGTVAISKGENGTETISVRLAHAGQTIGYRNYLNDMICTTNAKALTNAAICQLDSQGFSSLIQQHPALEKQFQKSMARDLDDMEDSIVQLASDPVRTRLARLLFSLVRRYSEKGRGNGTVLKTPMTWRDMSELLCTRPETLTRALQAMENDGIIHHKGHLIQFHDLERLKAEINPH